jgi:hypothetical protein
MRRSLRLAATAILLAGLVGTVPAPANQNEAAKVTAVIARSKLTRSTYAVYFWNRIQPPGQEAAEEWSAEFNSGSLHRVETPRDRLIADCAAHTGTYLSLVTHEVVTGPQIAGVACGINTNRPFLALEALGRVKIRFIDADRVRVTDAENVRTYDISDDGIILRTTFETNDARHLLVLDVEAVEVSRSLPSSNIFDEASLNMSFVPDRLKAAPRPR